MAVAEAAAALSSVAPKLAELIACEEEYNLQRGVKDDIIFLLRELESMCAAFVRIPKLVQSDEQLRLWANDAKGLCFSLEGLVDTSSRSLRTDATPGGLKGFVAKNSVISKMKINMAHRQFAGEIKGISHLLNELTERRDRYQIDSDILPTRHRRLQAPDVGDSPDESEEEDITSIAVKLLAQMAEATGNVNKFPSKVKGAIHSVQRELEYIQVALRMIAEVPTDELDEGTKAWAEDMKDVSSDVKDAVDNFNSSMARRKFSSDILDLKQQILELADRRRSQRYNIDGLTSAWRRRFNISSESPSYSIRHGLSDLVQGPGSLVAIDRPRDALAKLLTDEGSTSNPTLKMVSIVGTAGHYWKLSFL